MAHKTQRDGTAYEISGGKALVDGTAYSIKSGKALVDGAAYELGFSNMPEITIRGSPMMAFGSSAYVYDESDAFVASGTYSLPVGTVLKCYVGADTGYVGKVVLNGETVFTKTGKTNFIGVVTAAYEYVVTCDATIKISDSGNSTDKTRVGEITITEE